MQVACLIIVSESPTWLRLSGRFDEAQRAECTLLAGDDLDLALLDDDADEPHLPQPKARPSLQHCCTFVAGLWPLFTPPLPANHGCLCTPETNRAPLHLSEAKA